MLPWTSGWWLLFRRGELRRIGIVSRGGACSWEQTCFREGVECIVWNEKEYMRKAGAAPDRAPLVTPLGALLAWYRSSGAPRRRVDDGERVLLGEALVRRGCTEAFVDLIRCPGPRRG